MVTGSKPSSKVYTDLIRSCNQPGEYSTCFTELQRDFITSRPTKLKSLIRLVKHWYRQVQPRDHPCPSPHTYACTGTPGSTSGPHAWTLAWWSRKKLLSRPGGL